MIMLNRDYPLKQKPERKPRFQPGQLVRHKRYGYRGVIVELDLQCEADDDWYSSNQTQPDRDQPWYHVLVHSSGSVTYPAESSLEEDPSSKPVDHPMIEMFFKSFDGQRYIRNDSPWAG